MCYGSILDIVLILITAIVTKTVLMVSKITLEVIESSKYTTSLNCLTLIEYKVIKMENVATMTPTPNNRTPFL